MRKAGILAGLVLICLVTLYFGRVLGVSYYRRWQAARLLSTVRQFHPGITTEAQARSALKPFARYESEEDELPTDRKYDEVSFAFQNLSPLPWTYFSVRIAFIEGLIAQMNLVEMQVDHAGYPHPNAASVTIYSNRLDGLPANFSGYSEHYQSTGGVDSKGQFNGFECCHSRFIRLDERATPIQFSQALNFQFKCLTSFIRCKDDRHILP